MEGYQKFLSAIAYYKVLEKPPNIPDFKLMVGSAETLQSLPLAIYKDYLPKQGQALVRPLQELPAEQVDPKLSGILYTPNDFIYNDFFLGEPTGGFD
jgi:hypothetical protein